MAWTCYSSRWNDARNDSDTDFQLMGSWISARLTDLGWGLTADTGQITIGSATRPGAPTANTSAGYEIRQSSGTGTDLFLKIFYGMGYNTACHGFWISAGAGTNGAGILTGVQSSLRQVGSAIHTATPYEATVYVAGDADNFVIGMAQEQTAANGCIFGIQRTCDEDGVDTNTGWWQYQFGYTSAQTSWIQYCGFNTGAVAIDNGSAGIFIPPRTVNSPSSTHLFYPLYGQTGSNYAPLRDVIAQNWGAVGGFVQVPNYNATRSYVHVLGTTHSGVWGVTHPSTVYVGMRVA